MKSIDKLRTVASDRRPLFSSLVTTYCDKEGEISDDDVRMALGIAIDEIEEELERDYVKLPKDKDGIPIRPNDEIVVHHPGMEPVYSTVTALILTDRWDFEQSCYETDSRDVNNLRDFYEDVSHVQPDSWERIEADAKKWMYENGTTNGVMKLIERCKALAGVE